MELLQSIQLLSFEPPLSRIPLRYCLAGNRRVRTDVTGVDIWDRGEGDHDFVGTSQTACNICSRTADVLANKSLPLSLSLSLLHRQNKWYCEHTRNMGNFVAVRKLVKVTRVSLSCSFHQTKIWNVC